jgi:hypothetical protein
MALAHGVLPIVSRRGNRIAQRSPLTGVMIWCI